MANFNDNDFDDPMRTKTIWLLLAVIVLPLPALLVGLGSADVTRHMEAMTLSTSQETWLRQHEDGGSAWLTPTRNGVPRIRKPPASVWMNLLAWSGLDPESYDTVDLVLRGRLLGVGFALLMLASVFWIGFQLRGPELGFCAALVIAATHAFLHQGRLASYDTHLMAWCALAVACGLRVISSERANLIFILPAGVAASLAFMTKGPISLAHIVIPLIAIGSIQPGKKIATLKTVVGTTLIALILAAPWYIHLYVLQKEMLPILLEEYRAMRTDYQPIWYYVGLLGMVFPWTFWLIAGLITPFRETDRKQRLNLLIPWLWFAAVFVAMSIPAAKQQRYIVPILPAAGLLIANAWLNADFKHRGVRVLRALHWSILILCSILLPLFMIFQKQMISFGVIEKLDFPGANPLLATLAGIALIIIATIGLWAHLREKRVLALTASATWMVLTFATAYTCYIHSYHSIYTEKHDCKRVMLAVGDSPLHYLYVQPPPEVGPDEKFLLYTRRIVPSVKDETLDASTVRFVITCRVPEQKQTIESHGYRHLVDFHDGWRPRCLYENVSKNKQ